MIIGGWILKNISHLIERGWNEEICGIVRRLDMLVKIGCLISVIILAVITQHVIGWAGSILHQIGDTGQNYALFVCQGWQLERRGSFIIGRYKKDQQV